MSEDVQNELDEGQDDEAAELDELETVRAELRRQWPLAFK